MSLAVTKSEAVNAGQQNIPKSISRYTIFVYRSRFGVCCKPMLI